MFDKFKEKLQRKKDESVEAEPEPVVEDEPEPVVEESTHEITTTKVDPVVASLLEPSEPRQGSGRKYDFDEFVDERMLVSHDITGKKEMKIKIVEVSDEHPPVQWKFGDRVKVNKILITIKHFDTQEVEEGECDIEQMEKELSARSHYTSTNRWVPATDIKNGYVVNTRHVTLISDAVALDYITF